MTASLARAAPAPVTTPADAPAVLLQFLRFAVGSEGVALRIDSVLEILEMVPMTPLPLMPPCVRGVMNLRGSVVPVIDLAARLGLGETAIGRRTCIVIVAVPGDPAARPQTLGVLVDAVHEVFDAPADELEPVPRLGTRVAAHLIRHMVRLRGQAMAALDLERVLDAQSLAALIAAHAMH